LPCCI